MKTIARVGILVFLLPTSQPRVSVATDLVERKFDVVVYGSTAPAITTAVRCAREGLHVAIVLPTPLLGGSLPSLGAVETHYRGVRAPILQEFCDRVKDYYRKRYGADSEQFRSCAGGSMITFEPHVAEDVLTSLVTAESHIRVLRSYIPSSVERDQQLIRAISFRSMNGKDVVRLEADAFVEAGYEGDLMAIAGAESRVGREARAEFNEPRAGRVFTHWLRGRYPRDAVEGHLNLVASGATTSEPIEGSTGAGDDSIQSYSFRLCLTDDPANRLQLNKPPSDYDRQRYAPILLSPTEKERLPLPFHHRFIIYSLREMAEMDHIFHGHALPNRKRSWNATNFTGAGKHYPNATWPDRGDIKRRHLEYALGLLYFLQHDHDMPDELREQAQKWGLARDEFASTDNLPPQLYVREARRLKGRTVFTEHDALVGPGVGRAPLHADAIGITEFSLDSLACTTDRLSGSLCDGQLFQMEVSRPGQVSFDVLKPRGLDNLLVVTTMSATHVGWGTVRQTPTLMHLAESAAWAIVLASRAHVCPAKVNVDRLQRHLVEHGIMISFFNDFDMACRKPYAPAMQYLGARGFFSTYDAFPDKPLTRSIAQQWAHTFGRMVINQLDPMVEAKNLHKLGDGEGNVALREFGEMLLQESPETADTNRVLEKAMRKLDIDADAPINRASACQLMYELSGGVAISPAAPDQTVWRSGEDGYHTYRIPSLLVTPKGTVLAFCEGRKNNQSDQGDIDLLVKRSADGGKTWSEQQIVWDDAHNTCGNPCPVVDQDTGVIWMMMTGNRGDDSGKKLHEGTGKGTRRVFLTSSNNDGREWTTPIEITEVVKQPDWYWYATGPGVGIQLRHGKHKGRLVIPCDYTAKDQQYGSHTVISDDHGKTWRIGGLIQPLTNECQVAELDDGKGTLLMNLRSAGAESNCRLQAFSQDGGETWSTAKTVTELPDPKCQGSLVRYSWRNEGTSRLLFSNPANPTDRKNLTVRLSSDDGKTWPIAKEIFSGPSAYSCLTRLPDGRVGLVFEGGPKHRREAIYFVSLSMDELDAATRASK